MVNNQYYQQLFD